ncbi:hypothetical protein K5F93_14725 [Pseudomonas protegens]|uniref:hypothetical protein n=1 Tax=Pseudomonas protegens TaxID=380021 RepID=UPI001C8E06AC|nr:hypothetical protein [Pseudomonas protegens]QZI73403.1 hypothetical protein K5F93_14725 [Pseudomonas protegens]
MLNHLNGRKYQRQDDLPTTLYFHNLQFLYKLDTISQKPRFKRRRRFAEAVNHDLFLPANEPFSGCLSLFCVTHDIFSAKSIFLDDRTKERKNRADILWMPRQGSPSPNNKNAR